MSTNDQMRGYLRDVRDGKQTVMVGQTHMLELWTLLKEGLDEDLGKIISLNYLSSGLTCQIRFADTKVYEVLIREVK